MKKSIALIRTCQITEAVSELAISANYVLRKDVVKGLKEALSRETNRRAKSILSSIIENARIAKKEKMPICQDTGMAVVFVEMGEDVRITGGGLKEAINRGIRQGYRQGYLRKSTVDPLSRKNIGNNTPAVIHLNIVKGKRTKITVMPKGFGSENVSCSTVLKPTDGADEIKNCVLNAVKRAGPNPCPPIILGIGIGGTLDKAAILAKQALLRPLHRRNRRKDVARLENSILKEINRLGIGPMGLGGKTTALAANIETFPTHIAALPVAVNISCHALRSATKIIMST